MQIVQDELEIDICSDAVKRLHPVSILEIGSQYGGTLGFWLKTGARHVISVDVDHSQLDRASLEAIRSEDQEVHLVTGNSRDPALIAQLDEKMKELSISQFDVAFIDGAHDYLSVKNDFATCLPRTSKLLIFNDPVLVEVGEFIAELTKASNGWKTVNVVNPNRRLPCPGVHTCGSDYLAETGGGNFLLFLSHDTEDVFCYARSRVERELAPRDPAFRPHRSYFHQRGLSQSAEYAAYWASLYPKWAFRDSRLFAPSVAFYRLSYEEQMRGRLERSLKLIREADKARRYWWRYLPRRAFSNFLKLFI